MLFRMIYDDRLAEAAYLIGCQKTGEAILIDPERDIDRYLAIAAREKLRVVAVAETHIHADFLSGARELAEKTGATVYVSDEGDADWKYQWLDRKSGGGSYKHRLLKDSDTFSIGNIEFKAIHTPGHTPEHICFLVTDRGGGADQPMGIVTGDFVFVGDLGRPDLLESAAGFAGKAEPSARRLHRTLAKLNSLPDWLQVWPAHGAGSACGKALGAVPQSTIGYEKRFNPAILAGATEAGFVDFILSAQPEPPLYFARMKRDNKIGPRLLGELPRPRDMTPEELASIDTAKSAIIDTRPWDSFRSGHLPGALFHPFDNSFLADVGSMVQENEPIYLIAEPGAIEEIVRALVRIGYDDIRGYVEPSRFSQYVAGARLPATRELSVDQAAPLTDSPEWFVLDVRRAAEFAESHIEGAHNIAHTRLLAHLAEVPRNKQILVHCRSGGRSARACALLQKHGYDVANLAGGMLAWEKAPHPRSDKSNAQPGAPSPARP